LRDSQRQCVVDIHVYHIGKDIKAQSVKAIGEFLIAALLGLRDIRSLAWRELECSELPIDFLNSLVPVGNGPLHDLQAIDAANKLIVSAECGSGEYKNRGESG
jgi:hypothetical protein